MGVQLVRRTGNETVDRRARLWFANRRSRCRVRVVTVGAFVRSGALALATGWCLPASAGQTSVFRAGVDLVTVGVTVSDRRGNLVTDLTAADFELFEDGRRQQVLHFGADAPSSLPLHLGLLLDFSESMAEDIAFTRTAAIKFLSALTEATDVTLVDFDTEVRVARYARSDVVRLIERIRSQKARGATALFDAIGVYLDGASGATGRTIMVLYTDGGDTRSALRLHEALNLVKASDVTVYAVGVFQHATVRARTEQQLVLRQLADASGGRAFFPLSVADLDKAYQQVLKEIRAQYVLGYVSSNGKADGAWRTLDIRLAGREGRELRVRARPGYFAPLRVDR
jgi:Ca-activated chloride channel family protein